jgi:hypothetical protein
MLGPLINFISGMIRGQLLPWGSRLQWLPLACQAWYVLECHEPVYCCWVCQNSSLHVARSTIFYVFCTGVVRIIFSPTSWHHDILSFKLILPWSWLSHPQASAQKSLPWLWWIECTLWAMFSGRWWWIQGGFRFFVWGVIRNSISLTHKS